MALAGSVWHPQDRSQHGFPSNGKAVRPPALLHVQQHGVSWVSFSWGDSEMPITPPYAMGEMPGAPRTSCWHSALTQGHSSPASPWAQPWEGTDLRGHRPTLAGLSKGTGEQRPCHSQPGAARMPAMRSSLPGLQGLMLNLLFLLCLSVQELFC